MQLPFPPTVASGGIGGSDTQKLCWKGEGKFIRIKLCGRCGRFCVNLSYGASGTRSEAIRGRLISDRCVFEGAVAGEKIRREAFKLYLGGVWDFVASG